jgi:osmotically inducible lipoprotein OsmB
MKTIQRFTFSTVSAATLFSLARYSNMSTQDKNTAIGAGIGAVGGAAVGGVIGHEVGDK